MTEFKFEKATKKRAKLRMAITGPAKSGKTYTALVLATTLANGGKIALIDTERGSASKYADLFEFDVLELEEFHPHSYIAAIEAAEAAGYSVLIVDSLSHAWEGKRGVLELHDDATKRSRSENSWAAWREVTPIHRELVDKILRANLHLIATMRSKMAYLQTENDRGKTVIKKVGLAPVQRQGMEYEFDILAEMRSDHRIVVGDTRCPAMDGATELKPDGVWFQPIVDWLSDGSPEPERMRTQATERAGNGQPEADEDWDAWGEAGHRRYFAKAGEYQLTDAMQYATFGVKSRKEIKMPLDKALHLLGLVGDAVINRALPFNAICEAWEVEYPAQVIGSGLVPSELVARIQKKEAELLEQAGKAEAVPI